MASAGAYFHERLEMEDGAECYLKPRHGIPHYGPCGDDGEPGKQIKDARRKKRFTPYLQAHHLIPQRVLRQNWKKLAPTPLSIVLDDYRNGVLLCRRHHRLADGILTGHRKRLNLRILDLPPRFAEFLDQHGLWLEAQRLYVLPPGHSLTHGDGRTDEVATSGHG